MTNFPGLCQVCGKPMNASVPLIMRCRCKGIKMGDKLIPMPKGGFSIKDGKIKKRTVVQKMERRRADEFLKRQKKEANNG